MLFLGPSRKPRQFEYRPRFYHPPEEDSEESTGHGRIHFQGRFYSSRREGRRQRKSVVGMLLLLLVVVYLLFYLQGLQKQEKRYSGPLKVEDIEVIEVSPKGE